MASLLPGFEYDVFISYRHKDNKYDGWVTEFVACLKKELDATFKDEISVYFDENPVDVTNILEGSIRKVGNHVRVTVQLIDAIPDKHMWANDYDFEDLKDIFSLHTKVSTDVASVLKGKLTTQDKAALATNYTVNPDAYRLYKRGRSFWAMRTVEAYDSAENYYKRAIDLDPNYALAYAGLADCYIYGLQGMTNLDEVQVAKMYLSKALALDSTLCEALTTKGFIESHTEHNWTKGEKTLEAAIRQNANYSLAHLYHGNISIFTGKNIEKGLDEGKTDLSSIPFQRL